MITQIVKIGNSQGIRIPKILLEQSGLTHEVELEVKNRQLIIRPKKNVRQGWENAFRAMAQNSDDQLLDRENLINQNSWDAEEWEW
jgi:antitoxin MazE